jgi:DNA-binding beta-propeller fold protein YncE
VIDTRTNSVTTTIAIPVGNEPLGVAVTSGGRKVYVAKANSNRVSVVDTAANLVIRYSLVDVRSSGSGARP